MSEKVPLVIDSSVVLAWMLEEPQPAWSRAFETSARHGHLDIRVPSFFWLEVGNNLGRRRGMTLDQVLEGLIRIETLGVADVELDRPMRLRSLDLAYRHRLTTYDAVYLALAVDMGVPLATHDAELGRAASSYGLRYGDEHPKAAREPRPTYGPDQAPDPVSLAAIGAYIARFREPVRP